MAYCIGNGAITIGGGSLGRTEQLPTLKLLCVDLCARHLDRLNHLGDMPIEVFIDLLRRAKGKATPDVVQSLQNQNERLLCDEVDIAFWKQAVEDHILRRTLPAPGPVLVERVNEHKKDLVRLQAEEPPAPTKEWSREVTAVLKALDEMPASVGMLKETQVGKTVSNLRKNADGQVARLANDLVRRWKEAARSRGDTASNSSGSNSRGSSSSQVGGSSRGATSAARVAGNNSGGGGSGGSGSGGGGVERTPAEEKQRAVEEGFQCRTWNALYQHLERLRDDKVRASSKRAREAREREQQKRPKMIVGKSRGEDFEKRPGRFGKAFAASSSSSSSSSSSPPPPSFFAPAARVRGFLAPSPRKTPNKIGIGAAVTGGKKIGGGNVGSGTSSSGKFGSGKSGSGRSGSGKSGSGKFGSGKSGSGKSGSGKSGSGKSGSGKATAAAATTPTKKKKRNEISSVADLRRSVLIGQRLSKPVVDRSLGGGAGKEDVRPPPPKRSAFFKYSGT